MEGSDRDSKGEAKGGGEGRYGESRARDMGRGEHKHSTHSRSQKERERSRDRVKGEYSDYHRDGGRDDVDLWGDEGGRATGQGLGGSIGTGREGEEEAKGVGMGWTVAEPKSSYPRDTSGGGVGVVIGGDGSHRGASWGSTRAGGGGSGGSDDDGGGLAKPTDGSRQGGLRAGSNEDEGDDGYRREEDGDRQEGEGDGEGEEEDGEEDDDWESLKARVARLTRTNRTLLQALQVHPEHISCPCPRSPIYAYHASSPHSLRTLSPPSPAHPPTHPSNPVFHLPPTHLTPSLPLSLPHRKSMRCARSATSGRNGSTRTSQSRTPPAR